MNEIITGDCLEVMKSFPDNHFSAIVTDPPYGLKFMGKDWDHGIPGIHFWQEALRICKPGSHLLSFGGTRTYHRLTCAIEDAGWEIRDCLFWVYGSGFPKSHNHFGIEGYGTALKPAVEPIIMAMKPLDGTFAQNAEKWGQAGINIDGCRIETLDCLNGGRHGNGKGNDGSCFGSGINIPSSFPYRQPRGRWPANIMLDEEAASILDEQSGINASRFFYCAKTSSRERNEGLEGMPLQRCGMMEDDNYPIKTGSGNLRDTRRQNNHPTVKPLKLMEYLIKLVAPPTDALILDPFAGSGSTILAAKRLGISAIGIEKQPEYADIARARVNAVKPEEAQLDMFNAAIR